MSRVRGAHSRQPHGAHRRTGFTLIEMVTSLAIVGLVIGSIASTTLMLVRTAPRDGDRLDVATRGRRSADRVVRELSTATAIIEATERTAIFDVPDRDEDGDAERIAISWSGEPGDPLVMSVNGVLADLEENVYAFELDWSSQSRTTAAPSAPAEGAEVLLASWNDTTDTDAAIKSSTVVALGVRPRLATDATVYRVTRARLWMSRSGSVDGTIVVGLHTANGVRPSTLPFTFVTFSESFAPVSPGWVNVGFSTSTTLAANVGLFIVVSAGTTSEPAIVPFASQKVADDRTSIAIGSRTILTTTWNATTDAAMPFELYGVVTRPGTVATTSTRAIAVNALLQVGPNSETTAFAADVLANAPEISVVAADETPVVVQGGAPTQTTSGSTPTGGTTSGTSTGGTTTTSGGTSTGGTSTGTGGTTTTGTTGNGNSGGNGNSNGNPKKKN